MKKLKKYIIEKNLLFEKLDLNKIDELKRNIHKTLKKDRTIFVCGNGGSASISNHFQVDFIKSNLLRKKIKPKIISLSNNIESITAIANDINYESIFSYQLKCFAKKDDLLICISSSGNSKNIINAIKISKKIEMKNFLLCGFDGGSGKRISDHHIHIPSNNYGIVEDIHQSILHMICQNI